MILNNVKMVGNDETVNIRINNEKISGISSEVIIDKTDPLQLSFGNAIVFPGLINSHDHLDFNLFPKLGDRIYSNYTEWGKHIHETYKNEIAAILKIPVSLRYSWGAFKNLLCGVTTVVNHGEYSGLNNDLITIFEDTHCLHSVQFEKNWKIKLNNPFKIKRPVTIHVGEGDDWLSFNEIEDLVQYNLLHKRIIGIHAVAMSESQAKKFDAIVWCPESNYFLLNKTAQVDLLKNHSRILFGTDSTLTGSWNIWDHLKVARETKLLTDNALYNSLNQNPAKTWQLNTGEIIEGKDADIVIAKVKQDKTGFDAFFALQPADLLLVTHKGNIRLFDEELLPQLKAINLNDFSKINLDNSCKYVQGDLPGLIEKILAHQPLANFPVSGHKPV